MGDSPVATSSLPHPLPEDTTSSTIPLKILGLPKVERRSSRSSTNSAVPVEGYSPATTDTSASPVESPEGSPSSQNTGFSTQAVFSHNPDGSSDKPPTAHVNTDGKGTPRLRQMLRFLSNRSNSLTTCNGSSECPSAPQSPSHQQLKKIVIEVVPRGTGDAPSAEEALRPPTERAQHDRPPVPVGKVARSPYPIGGDDEMSICSENIPSSPCVSVGVGDDMSICSEKMVSSPRVSVGVGDDMPICWGNISSRVYARDDDDMSICSEVCMSVPCAPVATKRVDEQGDHEEGGIAATSVRVMDEAQTTTIVQVDVAPVATTGTTVRVVGGAPAAPAVVNSGIILPCPPSDDEKVK